MGFRNRNARKSNNKSKTAVVMGKPASQLTKEDKKLLSARMAEIKKRKWQQYYCTEYRSFSLYVQRRCMPGY